MTALLATKRVVRTRKKTVFVVIFYTRADVEDVRTRSRWEEGTS